MAIFDDAVDNSVRKYIAIYAKDGKTQVGTAFPSGKIKIEVLAEAMTEKGLHVEVKESLGETTEVEL